MSQSKNAIYALQDYSNYEEFIAAEPSYAENPELLHLIKEFYGYEDPKPVKKKAPKKVPAKKASKKAMKKKELTSVAGQLY